MTEMLTRNLTAMERTNSPLAAKLRDVAPRPGVAFEPAKRDEALSAAATANGRTITLCSKHAPLAEADRLADQVDLETHAVFVVLGIGAGHQWGIMWHRWYAAWPTGVWSSSMNRMNRCCVRCSNGSITPNGWRRRT